MVLRLAGLKADQLGDHDGPKSCHPVRAPTATGTVTAGLYRVP